MTRSRMWREGITAGLLGAGGVALWFFVVDLIAGRPLYTPAMLGHASLSVLGGDPTPEGTIFNAAVYTVFHVVAFIGIGTAAAKLVSLSERIPHVTVGLLLFFVTFELGFYFVAMFLSQFDIVGRLAWYQIGAANIIAAAAMGTYLWRRHPQLKTSFELALSGRE